jgi:hypothetical protein
LIQSAAVNAARFDHDPVTLASRGLLIEEGSENLFIHSSDISSWNAATRVGLNTSGSYLNITTAPDGTLTADKIVEDASTSQHGLGMSNVAITALSNYTFSFYAKAAERSIISVFDGAYTASVAAHFNLSSGVSTINTLLGFSGRMTPAGDGWYRCVVTYAPPVGSIATQSFARLRINKDGSLGFTVASITYTGDNTSGLYVWGTQFEQKAFPTSYIPTTTGSVVRSADVCSITGSDFTGMAKTGEGSVVVHGDSYQGTTPAFCQVSTDPGGSRSFNFQRNASTGALEHSDSSAGINTVSATPSFPVKFGASRNQAVGLCVFYNGVLSSSSAFTTNGVQTRMLIGNSSIGLPLNGCIRSIKHFKKRLPDAKMQTLTAP